MEIPRFSMVIRIGLASVPLPKSCKNIDYVNGINELFEKCIKLTLGNLF